MASEPQEFEIEELMARVFAARDIAHRAHLLSVSYAEHMALDSFYHDVVDAIDAVAETHIALFGVMQEFRVETQPVSNILDYLREESDWIEANRDVLSGGSNAIGNLIDNVTAVYLSTIYKLSRLK